MSCDESVAILSLQIYLNRSFAKLDGIEGVSAMPRATMFPV